MRFEEGADDVHVWLVPEESLDVLVPNVGALQQVTDVTNLPNLRQDEERVHGSLGGVLEAGDDLSQLFHGYISWSHGATLSPYLGHEGHYKG